MEVVVQRDGHPLAEGVEKAGMGDAGALDVDQSIKASKVVVFGKSTCPFCIEVTRTLTDMSVPFTYHTVDNMPDGTKVHEHLKATTGQRTVPYVFINGNLVGGCDATKALIASGQFYEKLGSVPGGEGKDGAVDISVDVTRVKIAAADQDAPNIVGALFQFPNSVDNRIIRLTGLQVFVISTLIAVLAYQKKTSWHWVSTGLLVDFCLRFYGGAGISPLGSIAQIMTAAMDLILPACGIASGPIWGAGPPKQFAVFVGICFTTVIMVLQFTHHWIPCTVIAGILAFFAALEAFLNFCAGCLVFSYLIKWGIVPDTVYMVHINTLPETKYTWNEWTKVVHPPEPRRVYQTFASWLRPGGKKTRVDLSYKTGKNDDYEREDFNPIKHVKIGFFSSVIGVQAVAAMFKFMSTVPTFGTPDLVWQILTLLSFVWTSLFLFPYILKMMFYPKKIYREWQHAVHQNAFTVPFMVIVIYAFLAEHYSRPLARVLFWAGAGPIMLLNVIIVGEWLATIRHEGHVNGAFQMGPVGNLIVAIVGPIVDPRYRDVSFLWFGFGCIMYITLFILTFQKVVQGYIADPKGRFFAAIFPSTPAVVACAWTVLTSPVLKMDFFAQTMFYIAFTLGMVVVWMVLRGYMWSERFFMPMWALSFPFVALSWAAVLYDWTIDTALSKVLAVCLISGASTTTVTLALRTLGGILRLKVFVPEHKWGPMAHLPLAQEALRALLQQLTDAVDALASNPSNTKLAERVAYLWRCFAHVNAAYIRLKNTVCLPQLGGYIPGHQAAHVAHNERMLKLQAAVEAVLSAALGAPGPARLTVSSSPAAAAAGDCAVPKAADGPVQCKPAGPVAEALEESASDLAAYPGATHLEKLMAATKQQQIVIVAKTNCPFCIEIMRTFDDMGMNYAAFKVDSMPGGAELWQELKDSTGQKTVPYVWVAGQMVGGCDATKALIANGQFYKLIGPGAAEGAGSNSAGSAVRALQERIKECAAGCRLAYDEFEDHVRPVTRKYVAFPSQRKIMNDCWDAAPPEEWFLTIPIVVQHLPMLGQRLSYLRAFLWAMPERCQQLGLMVALGVDPVTWFNIKRHMIELIPRGERGWKEY